MLLFLKIGFKYQNVPQAFIEQIICMKLLILSEPIYFIHFNVRHPVLLTRILISDNEILRKFKRGFYVTFSRIFEPKENQ